MKEIRGTRVLIVGYGSEGKSVRSYLTKNEPGVSVDVTDQKDGTQYLSMLDAYDTVIRSPGVPPYAFTTRAWVTTATNIFFSQAQGMTIGVTGTKGKSTTASLIAHLLRATYADVRLCGNIGYPMLDALKKATKDTVFVVELSSHQLVDVRYSPHIAVLLSVVPEHLDYYPDFAAYTRAKENIYRFQGRNDRLIRSEKNDERFDSSLMGNDENIAAAVRVARMLSVPEATIRAALKTFIPLPHRLELVGTFGGIQYVNDSLATIPEATIHALDALGSRVATLIAGGYDRGIPYDQLGNRLVKSSVQTLILFPDTGKKIQHAVVSASAVHAIRFVPVNTMEEAVCAAKKYTPKDAICLLSPASASFNLFTNYEDRGNQFCTLVRTSLSDNG